MQEPIDFRRWAGPLMESEGVARWRAGGGRVAGYLCTHAPEEFLWAAGLLPLRMRGTGSLDTTGSDAYLGTNNCSFVRHTLALVLDGDLAFLDALIVTNSCDHVRRIFDICSAKAALPHCYYLDVPHVRSESARARLVAQLRDLRRRLELDFEVTLDDAKLSSTLKLYNRTRALLLRASALRSEEPPRASGSELLTMSIASASMPKDQFNELLEQHLEQLEARAVRSVDGTKRRPRLLFVGGMLDDPGYLEVFESLGADIVDDQLCCGAKTFSRKTDEDTDPIEAIARRMLEHVPCPRMVDDYPARLRNVVDAIGRHRVDGVVCQRLKFCDLWGGEIEMLRSSLMSESQVRVLVLERDYLTASGIGQLRTRAQAFLETLG
jgi:benzoyl-CoA reductase/2-hydroxyglutaryl-CoA dehydratase subunit BcrC/BadD/HgdB